MEKAIILDTVAAETGSVKEPWSAPQVVETDIDAITLAGSGASGDGVTTTS